MKIAEIFYSVQGEGKYLGVPVVFVRTQGCSAHCPFCDSKPTWMEKGPERDYQWIEREVNRVGKNKCKTVVITGGEPTEQRDLYNIVQSFKYDGYTVHLETNGSHELSGGYFTHIVCSPKEACGWKVPKAYVDELKYVVSTESDLNRMIDAGTRDKFAGRIWLQPMDECNPEKNEANRQRCVKEALNDPRLRVGLQYHKILNVR